MKKLIFTILLGLFCYPLVTAQLSDNNTETINQYFQVNENQPAQERIASSKKDSNMGSFVQIVQTGKENNIRINSLQSGDEQFVSQNGQQNNYEYYNYYSNQNSNMQINQEGNLNSVQVFGENSLMKDAKINQKSDFKSIIVKNYSK